MISNNKKNLLLFITILLFIPVNKIWFSCLTDTLNSNATVETNNNTINEDTFIIATKENNPDELEEQFPQRSDKKTEVERQSPVSQEEVDKNNHISQNNTESKNDAETQNVAPKKEKSGKWGIVDAANTPLKFEFFHCNMSASLEYDPSYDNLTSLNVPHKVRYKGEIYTVKYIDNKVFYHDFSNIVKIEIPSSIKYISFTDFNHFKNLTAIIIEPGHPTLSTEDGILYNKDMSEILRVPLGFKGTFKCRSSVKKIGSYAFRNCKGVTNIEFSPNVTEIGEHAFYDCNGLTHLVIPSHISSIKHAAFSNCKELTNVEIQVPTEVEFGPFIFAHCTKLKSINIPPHLTELPKGFLFCANSFENFEIPSHITSIGQSTFSGCLGLTYVTIPKSVTKIGVNAFSGCKGLTNIIIPANVSSIGASAFANCTNLNVLVDNSKKNVEYEVSSFQGCKSLKWAK